MGTFFADEGRGFSFFFWGTKKIFPILKKKRFFLRFPVLNLGGLLFFFLFFFKTRGGIFFFWVLVLGITF